ncbi:hypothetical protein F5Y19DRAFT_88715 [Xylariaceae sp. FL1651]|nr:hypothetical protein F5Y19DRAFT_88715 [Xylariaceae sp. FL1651]
MRFLLLCYLATLSASRQLHRPFAVRGNSNSTSVAGFVGITSSADPNACGVSKPKQIAMGDTCYSLATSNGISVDQLIQANPSLKSDGACDDLQIGVTICIPDPSDVVGSLSSQSTVTATSSGESNTATTAPATTTTFLSRTFLTTLTISGSESSTDLAAATTGSCFQTYIVVAGDTCDEISRAQGISLAEFLKLNPGTTVGSDGNCPLLVGQRVCIAEPGDNSVTATASISSDAAAASPSSSGPEATASAPTADIYSSVTSEPCEDASMSSPVTTPSTTLTVVPIMKTTTSVYS